jgi:hypothetical protein
MRIEPVLAVALLLTAAILPACAVPPEETVHHPPVPRAADVQEPQAQSPADIKERIDKLVAKLAEEKYSVREAAESELKNMLLQDIRKFDTILSTLKGHLTATSDLEVRFRLERMGLKEYIRLGITGSLLRKFPDILAQLSSHAPAVRESIAARLGDSKQPDAVGALTRLIQDSKPAVRLTAASALIKIGEPAVKPLIRILGENLSLEINLEIAEILIGIGKPAVIPLTEVLDHPDPTVRTFAAWARGETENEGIEKPLIAVRRSKAPEKSMPKATVKVIGTNLAFVLERLVTLSGAKVVIAPDVQGKVSVIMRDVPWRTAFETIVKTLGFVIVEEDDNILRVVRPESLTGKR